MDEQLKRQLMLAVMCFNITVIVMMILLSVTGAFGASYMGTFWARAGVSVGVGAVVAVVILVIQKMSNR